MPKAQSSVLPATQSANKKKKSLGADPIAVSKMQEHEPIEGGSIDEVNKTAGEVKDGLSDNLQLFNPDRKCTLWSYRRSSHVPNLDRVDLVSGNIAAADLDVNGDEGSPRFTREDAIRVNGANVDADDASISLTQYYLKGSVQERKTAPNEQEEFVRTLNQMEKEDVPAQVIDEYRKAEILRKSMAVVKKHAERMNDIRTSPERYDRVKGKINTKNPFAANLSSVAGSKRSMMVSGLGANNQTSNRKGLTRVDSPIKEETMQSGAMKGLTRRGGADQTNGDWYRPELGDIPHVPLTKANREKIEKRDKEIAEKEAELDQIMESIN